MPSHALDSIFLVQRLGGGSDGLRVRGLLPPVQDTWILFPDPEFWSIGQLLGYLKFSYIIVSNKHVLRYIILGKYSFLKI